MSGEELAVTGCIASLRKKLRGSGCLIREKAVEVTDADDPGTVRRQMKYIFTMEQSPDG